MNFDIASICVSFVFSSIGFGLFMYGKKQQRLPQIVFGIILMAYSYVVPNAILMAVIGVVLVGLSWVAAKRFD